MAAPEFEWLDGALRVAGRAQATVARRARVESADGLEFGVRETEDMLSLGITHAGEIGDLSVHESSYRLWHRAMRAVVPGDGFPLVPGAAARPYRGCATRVLPDA